MRYKVIPANEGAKGPFGIRDTHLKRLVDGNGVINSVVRWVHVSDASFCCASLNNRFNMKDSEGSINTPEYYDNSKGSLYKLSNERGWNAYLFDIVKRLERGGKKDPIVQEIDKSIAVLQLWKSELS